MSTRKLTLVWVTVLLALPAAAPADPIAEIEVAGAEVRFQARAAHAGAVLTVSTPDGTVLRYASPDGLPSFGLYDADGELRPDGVYQWELRLDLPATAASQPRRRRAAPPLTVAAREPARGSAPELVQSGSFVIVGGAFLDPAAPEERSVSAAAGSPRNVAAPDVVFPDNLIVQRACVGYDCVNGEFFGSLTPSKIKTNDPRLLFEDSSVSPGFPSNDWQLTANDTVPGGANKFSIEDVSGGRVPFTITAFAPTNSFFMDSVGRVGLGTSTPTGALHIANSDENKVVLQHTGPPPRTWSIVANGNFFYLNDNGSTLPFIINAGAPSGAFTMAGDGDVGFGTLFGPAARMHVLSTAAGIADSKLLVESQSATPSPRELLELRNATGQATLVFKNATEPERWANGTFSRNFVINNQGNPGVELSVGNTGNLTASGSMNATAFNVTSDRNLKTAIVPVLGAEVLAKLASIPISTWTLKTETVRHIGPMAQDFAAAFGLGADDRHISVSDLAGVSLAAIQALHREVASKAAELEELQVRLAARDEQLGALQARLATLEAAVGTLAGN